MTDSIEHFLEVSGTELIVVDEMATKCGVTSKEFILQSVHLGIALAELAVEAWEIPYEATVIFEEQPGDWHEYVIDFGPDPDPETPEDEPVDISWLDHELELAQEAGTPEEHPLDDETAAQVLALADRFGGDLETFVNCSIFYRFRWAMAQSHCGKVAVDNGTEDGVVFASREIAKQQESDPSASDD